MKGYILLLALTTGAFCAVFAMFVATVTTALQLWQVACIGGISGFLGSLLASLVWGRGDGHVARQGGGGGLLANLVGKRK